jgi:hypothetical protein
LVFTFRHMGLDEIIKEALRKGFSKEEIKSILTDKGYNKKEINSAFDSLGGIQNEVNYSDGSLSYFEKLKKLFIKPTTFFEEVREKTMVNSLIFYICFLAVYFLISIAVIHRFLIFLEYRILFEH